MSRPRKSWPPIVARAADLVDLSPTGVTLRQVFYLLVSEGLIGNVRRTDAMEAPRGLHCQALVD